jgi:large subunit ribosomal protein L9
MKVILLQELKGRGGEGDVIDVAQGFAVNYLLPRKIAIQATSGNIKQLEHRMHNIKKREDQRLADANALSEALVDKTVTISAKAGEEGRLFGSVTSVMVEEAIHEQLGIEIDRRKIETHGHIKNLGPHTVDVSIYREVKVSLTVNVVADGAAVPAAAPVAEPVAEEVSEASAEQAETAEAEEDTVAAELAEVVAEDDVEEPAVDIDEAPEA